jgi:hypothetical protein
MGIALEQEAIVCELSFREKYLGVIIFSKREFFYPLWMS